ncbi:MAG: hypothetical protein HKN09_10085 [Saprospiraceae bacterium]|nr:hypothetical protein [Saprospiraceae bacterium]
MFNKFQIDRKYARIGWIMLIPALILGLLHMYSELEPGFLDAKVFALLNDDLSIFSGKDSKTIGVISNNIFDELLAIFIVVGSLLIVLAKEEVEDEYILQLRQESMFWALITHSILLLFTIIFVYGMTFLNIMVFNLFMPLLLFIGRFRYVLYKASKV